ncbi:MAG: thioredoxin domain-containing protein, partial [Candidatus Geothermincolia bacterium]
FFELTLESMGDRGMYDQVEGGFFRYSVNRDYSVPHYEKMLEDNARLILVYLRAHGLTGDDYYRDKAAHAAAYVFKTLSDGSRSFFGSQDADEAYYGKKPAARLLRPPLVDRTMYTGLSALAARAFLKAGIILGKDEYLGLA